MSTPEKTLTMQQLADKLQLSRATVSYVLSGQAKKKKIHPETERRIWDAVRKSRYIPNYWAQSLVQKNPSGIGVAFPDLRLDAAHELFLSIDSVLQTTEHSPFLTVSSWDPEREQREINSLLCKKIAGLICLPTPGNWEFYRELQKWDVPVMYICDTIGGIDTNFVMLDGGDAMRKIIAHLAAMGHKRLASIFPAGGAITNIERKQALIESCEKHGIAYNQELHMTSKLGYQESVFQDVETLMKLKNPPTAIVAANDAIAYQILDKLLQLGIVPGTDIAVTGIGDIIFSSNNMCNLTTVVEPRAEIGRIATEFLLKQIDDPANKPAGIKICGDLIVRGSTATFRCPDTSDRDMSINEAACSGNDGDNSNTKFITTAMR